ncbi:hypothetical protein EJ03DRAFT_108990 [Teratosphaeria nubilosa]|uniref:Uncharacterized protein n=1 Tax=Teratosphaeria nubilosa TaxID=161662 RepID=A0A6G1L847_9PEZI|nr:hypothetical protein EJ03DRAFT_108990 [Teratosphaeria nubilosa]
MAMRCPSFIFTLALFLCLIALLSSNCIVCFCRGHSNPVVKSTGRYDTSGVHTLRDHQGGDRDDTVGNQMSDIPFSSISWPHLQASGLCCYTKPTVMFSCSAASRAQHTGIGQCWARAIESTHTCYLVTSEARPIRSRSTSGVDGIGRVTRSPDPAHLCDGGGPHGGFLNFTSIHMSPTLLCTSYLFPNIGFARIDIDVSTELVSSGCRETRSDGHAHRADCLTRAHITRSGPSHRVALPKSKTKKKRVVIQTPPHSPEEPSIPRRASDGLTGSPPPPIARRDDDDDVDSAANSDLEQTQINTTRNSGPLPPPTTIFGIQTGTRSPAAGSGLPYNPFARTLATSEAQYGLHNQSEQQQETNGNNERQSAGRPTLDVDAFKNILLTGKAAPSARIDQQQQSGDSIQDRSSTQPSAASRQSAFDQMHEAFPESPRTSLDDYARYSDDSDDDASNEDSSLMGPIASRPVEEGPPLPPKQARAYPQTVSFADFDNTLSAGTRPSTPPLTTQFLHGNTKPSLSRSPSDLNKPLPPPPAVSTSASQPTEQVQPVREGSSQEQTHEHETSQSKRPPPLPASRRQGQSTPAQKDGRTRSTSNVSQSSSQYGDKPPPPPPSRRPQSMYSSTPSPAKETPPSLPPTNQVANGSRTQPPPPPRRMISKSGTPSIRTASTASRHSLQRKDSSNALPTSGAIPPAPPPRRGGQKRNSTEGPPISLATRRVSGGDHFRRASAQSFESDRSVSLSSLKQVAEPEGGEEAVRSSAGGSATERDILADMSAFQAEIDALRAQRQS